jgi:hypothetical protein
MKKSMMNKMLDMPIAPLLVMMPPASFSILNYRGERRDFNV